MLLHNLPIPATLIFLFLILVVAVFTDLKSRKIPNWLVLAGLIGMIGLHFAEGGSQAAKNGLLGAFYAFLATVPFVFFKLFGAGDSKLSLVLGAAVSISDFFLIMAFALMMSGVMGLMGSLFAGRIKHFGANLNIGIISALNFDWSTAKSVAEHTAYRIPFALPMAAAAGVWLFWFY